MKSKFSKASIMSAAAFVFGLLAIYEDPELPLFGKHLATAFLLAFAAMVSDIFGSLE